MYAHLREEEITLYLALLPLPQVKRQETFIESRIEY